jgi:hypothetical protein
MSWEIQSIRVAFVVSQSMISSILLFKENRPEGYVEPYIEYFFG